MSNSMNAAIAARYSNEAKPGEPRSCGNNYRRIEDGLASMGQTYDPYHDPKRRGHFDSNRNPERMGFITTTSRLLSETHGKASATTGHFHK